MSHRWEDLGPVTTALLRSHAERTIALKVSLVKALGGDLGAAVMLCQFLYWSERSNDPEGWFYNTEAEFEDQTGVGVWTQKRARKLLENAGLLEVVRRGLPARLFYRLNLEAVAELIVGTPLPVQTEDEPQEQVVGKPHNLRVGKPTTGCEVSQEQVVGKPNNFPYTDANTEARRDANKDADVVGEKSEKAKTTTTPPQDDRRSQNLNLIKAKLGLRHSNTPKDEEVDLLTECFAEDPSRDLWLDLPPARVRALIHQSQQKRKGTRFGTFKGFFIEALDLEAQTDKVKPTTTAPPVAAAPPRRSGLSEESEKMIRESMGEDLYEEMYGKK